MTPEMLIGIKMKALHDKPNGARLQATTLAMAALGAFSPPFDRCIGVDELLIETDKMGQAFILPIKDVQSCTDAFKKAVGMFEAVS